MYHICFLFSINLRTASHVYIITTLNVLAVYVYGYRDFIPTLIVGVIDFLFLPFFGGGGMSTSEELELSATFQNTL